jgi:iron complex outermembrane receptor protein
LAWNTLFQHKGWSVFAAFRGAFGHYLVNRTRQFYEFSQLPNVVYNQINSDLKVPGLRNSIYSSLWVEKADFFTLDNLTIAKSFQFGSRRKSEIRVSLTGQILFVLSNYSGVDPEPALEDIGMGFFGQNLAFEAEANPFSVGVDRRGGYRPARTFVLGVGIRI